MDNNQIAVTKGGATMQRIDKQRLVSLFCELAEIRSPSGEEVKIAKILIEKLKNLGLTVKQDSYGNVIAKLEGVGEPLIFCAHMDTVRVDKPVRPQVKKTVITSDETTILGGDNKDSIAAILEAIAVVRKQHMQHRAIEVIFTREEERISGGVKHLDTALFSGRKCIISDSSTPYGTIILSAPFCFLFNIRVEGKKAHVKEPEKGINVIQIVSEAIGKIKPQPKTKAEKREPLGRIDQYTTFNIGYHFSGIKDILENKNPLSEGESIASHFIQEMSRNSVPDLSVIFGEVRGSKIQVVRRTLKRIEATFKCAAKKFGGKATIEPPVKLADGYFLKKTDGLVAMARDVFEAQGVKPIFIHSTGGSDANFLVGKNIASVVISSAHRNNHAVSEYVIIKDLVRLADFYVKIMTTTK